MRPVLMAAGVLAISACGGDGGPVEPQNQSPVAQLSVSPEQGYVGTVFQFDGSQSHDPDGSISSYRWDFGDGNSGSGETTEHTYTSEGNYEACLTVTDNKGATNRSCLNDEVLVEQPEVLGEIAYMHQDRTDSNNWVDRVSVVSFVQGANGVEVLERNDLTEGSEDNWYPAWSPDGERIAFTTNRDEDTSIYLMDLDGNMERLTDNLNYASQPDWCSVDERIAFRYIDGNEAGIAHINPDGTGLTKVVVEESPGDFIRPPGHPSWSPDCSEIAYTTHRDGNWEIYVVDLLEMIERNITNNPAIDADPVFSSDGKILFWSDRGGNSNLYSVENSGDGLEQITSSEGNEYDAEISDDGRYVMFSHSDDGGHSFQVYISPTGEALDESNWTQLTSLGSNRDPSWRPNPNN